jgi:uncharacterized protein (TIGR00369 family)
VKDTSGGDSVQTLSELYQGWVSEGMIANIGARIVDVGAGTLVLECTMVPERHGFPTARGMIVHGGAIATLADECLASVAFTVAGEGEATTTSSLQVDYYRPAALGKLLARGVVRKKTRRLAYCHASVEQEDGTVVAEARAVIAFVPDR